MAAQCSGRLNQNQRVLGLNANDKPGWPLEPNLVTSFLMIFTQSTVTYEHLVENRAETQWVT